MRRDSDDGREQFGLGLGDGRAGERSPCAGERPHRGIRRLGGVADRQAQESFERPVDPEARACGNEEALATCGERELRTHGRTEADPRHDAAVDVRHVPLGEDRRALQLELINPPGDDWR